MVRDTSNSLISPQQLTNILGHHLSELELSRCLKQIKYLEPKVGQFWQTADAEAGVYIVISGKVRLINSAGELITNLEAGASFGECTFFPEEFLERYSARASIKTKLCYLTPELLIPLISKYPQIREHFYCKAQAQNSLLMPSESLIGEGTGFTSSGGNLQRQPLEKRRLGELTKNKGISVTEDLKSGKKLNKAYFPSPTQQVGHLWQRVIQRYPFFAQQSASDCGAACLVMVARYWGKRFSVNRLRDISNVDRNGASLRGLSTAAESISFSTRPVKASLDRLAQQQLPAIIHWEGKHFIVVYEITNKEVVIADPAIGQKTLGHQEFKANWTGYALLLQPTALLKETEESKTYFWQFFELVKPHGLVLLEVFIASVIIQVFGLITPIFTQIILDRVVVQSSALTLTAIGLGLLIFSLFRVAITGLREYLLDHTANKVDIALIVGFIRHTLRLPLSFFESRYVGDSAVGCSRSA